jgi:hypothetical protein
MDADPKLTKIWEGMMSAYHTSIDQERALFAHVMENGPTEYAIWAAEFQAFRNQVLAELEKLKIPDEWLVRASLAASHAWESRNPCPITRAEIDHLRQEAAAALGFEI